MLLSMHARPFGILDADIIDSEESIMSARMQIEYIFSSVLSLAAALICL